MIPENRNLVVELLEAIEADWALCDEKDEDQHMILVNEDRDEHQSLRPQKSLVRELEAEGYLQFDESKSDPKNKRREYMEFLDETIPVRFVYFYTVTDKGRELHAKFKYS